MDNNIQEGLYILQGPETNLLVRMVGKSPLNRISGAIDLNYFLKTGKARELDENSLEIVDVNTFPEKYTCLPPALSDAIRTEGLKDTKESTDVNINDSDELTFVKKLLNFKQFHGKSADIKMKIWLKREKGYSFAQSNFIIKTLNIKLMNGFFKDRL